MSFKVFHFACAIVLAALLMSVGTGVAKAQGDTATVPPVHETLTVGVYVDPPFVMKEKDNYSGMAIELWEKFAGNLGRKFKYVEMGTIRELVDATAAGDIDVALTNLTITKDRVERIDFTHPWFDGGLRIMVNEGGGAGFQDVISGLRESGHLRAYGWIAFIIIIATLLVTLFDRRFDKDFPRGWRDGFAESFYTVMSVATSGKPAARKNLFGWVGRIWQGLWLICGIAVLAYLTSSVTSVMTTLSLSTRINSVADLPGHPVGVFTGSVAEQYARESRLDVRAFANLDEAVTALVNGQIDAIVGDTPVLEYYVHTNPNRGVMVVGEIFEPDKYGFGLPHGSELTRPLTVQVVGAQESGQIETIRARYFGEND